MESVGVEFILGAIVIAIFMLAVIHQQHLVTRIVKQNKDFVSLCAEQNRSYLESADKRLSKANEMVLECTKSVNTLAESADKLAVIMLDMKEVIYGLRQYNEEIVKEIRENRDKLSNSYIKLLTEYEALDKEFKDELKLLANKPTITNNNIPEQTTI